MLNSIIALFLTDLYYSSLISLNPFKSVFGPPNFLSALEMSVIPQAVLACELVFGSGKNLCYS